jgi:hypothetical protein
LLRDFAEGDYTDRFGLTTLMGCYANSFGLNAECALKSLF